MVVRKLSQEANSLRSGKSRGVSFHCSTFKLCGAVPGQEKMLDWYENIVLAGAPNDDFLQNTLESSF